MEECLLFLLGTSLLDFLFPIVTSYVLNQSKSHSLLSNALQSAIIMCLKFREKFTNLSTLINLIDDDFGIPFELSLFVSNIRKEVCGVWDSFLSFLRKFEKRKVHNMLSLMLDPRFKNLCLVSSFVGRK
jgi:hypothetical protein